MERMEDKQNTDTIVVNSSKTLEEQMRAIELIGLHFFKPNKIRRLLIKTQGDFDTVRDYVIAYAKLQKSLENGRTLKLQKKTTKRSQRQAISAFKLQEFNRKRELLYSSRVALDSPPLSLPKPELQYEPTRVTLDSPPLSLPEAESQSEPARPLPSENRILPKFADSPLSWPQEGSHLFLDGNNMLYVIKPIRDLAVRRRNLSQASSFLQRIARDFTEIMNLENCTLMFDNTRISVNESRFSVVSARPHFRTSDDALVELATKTKGLFVTSDKELIQRLRSVGASIWSPKTWFGFVASTLSCGPVDDVNTWAYQ